ncbi:unnamed protein product [Brassica oleracea]|uniref:Uncharacterized protein n=1 Tax=Brassica oleracea TaxID=3712 RepID=A0A3P6AMA5_BRAOL|nr:unnamed protein product [Brassica oleracea]
MDEKGFPPCPAALCVYSSILDAVGNVDHVKDVSSLL